MHDGSIATLEEVIDHYAAGGRGTGAARGTPKPYTSPLIRRFVANEQERADLVHFLHSLTDQSFVRDTRFASPFE